LDFGISVMVERGLDPSAGPVMPMGTPAYMSPEHILGVPDIDGRADVYGFGVLLYESLTGQMPFPGEPSPTLFDHILHKPAAPVTVVRPDLPAGLVHIIEKAMAKDRDQRYADVTSLATALEDELTPATPAPRLLTPQAGVPSFAAHDPLSGPHAPVVQAVLSKEPSGEHQGTRILCAFPLETEDKESAVPAGPNGFGPEEAAPPLPSGRDTALVDVRAPLRRTRSRGARSALRGWGGLLGAGFAVVVGFSAVSVAMRGVRRLQVGAPAPIADGMPPAREPVVQAAVSASSATVDPVAVPAPVIISPPPGAPATREHGHPVRHAHDMPVLATPSHSHVAAGETSNDLSPRQQVLRRASGREEPVATPAQRAGASAKSPAPRAGPLSRDDF
jgi:hypothetical protein